MQIVMSHPNATVSETVGVGPTACAFPNPAGDSDAS